MRQRLDRQFDAFGRLAPRANWILAAIRRRRLAAIRIPVALTLMAGSVLAILPVFGLWMLPLGLLLLSIDLPPLQPMVTSAIVRLRRRAAIWTRRLRH